MNLHSHTSGKKHIQTIKTNKQISKYSTQDTLDKTLDILHIEKKGQSLNTLERLYINNLCKQRLQMNATFAAIHNSIFDLIQ